jgi:hypothetical protein
MDLLPSFCLPVYLAFDLKRKRIRATLNVLLQGIVQLRLDLDAFGGG